MKHISPTATSPAEAATKNVKEKFASYRGFVSIDQEMEREIAMNFFQPGRKNICYQKGFLQGKNPQI